MRGLCFLVHLSYFKLQHLEFPIISLNAGSSVSVIALTTHACLTHKLSLLPAHSESCWLSLQIMPSRSAEGDCASAACSGLGTRSKQRTLNTSKGNALSTGAVGVLGQGLASDVTVAALILSTYPQNREPCLPCQSRESGNPDSNQSASPDP